MARLVLLAIHGRGHAHAALTEALLRELQVTTGGKLRGSDVFVPHLQNDGLDASAAFTRTLTALQDARVVVAALDGAQVDDEVAFLVGYAFAAGKPVVGYATDARAKSGLIEAAVSEIAHDVRALSVALAKHL